jgi:hypothetical protein
LSVRIGAVVRACEPTARCSVPRVKNEREGSLLRDWRVRGLIGCGMVAGFLIAALIFGKPSHLAPNWGDIPTWLAVAVATAGGWIALSQLRSQQEVLRQDGQDRRRAQAARVFISAPRERDRPGWVRPSVKNASDFPIYESELWYISPDGLSVIRRDDGYRGTIQPGAERLGPELFPSKEGLRRAIITFRDANNVFWIRMPGGALEEQPARPELESVRAALRTLPPELGPRGAAVYGARGEDAVDADDND